jgi:hypothetical protein
MHENDVLDTCIGHDISPFVPAAAGMVLKRSDEGRQGAIDKSALTTNPP